MSATTSTDLPAPLAVTLLCIQCCDAFVAVGTMDAHLPAVQTGGTPGWVEIDGAHLDELTRRGMLDLSVHDCVNTTPQGKAELVQRGWVSADTLVATENGRYWLRRRIRESGRKNLRAAIAQLEASDAAARALQGRGGK